MKYAEAIHRLRDLRDAFSTELPRFTRKDREALSILISRTEASERVIEELRALIHSGYDGPFMGLEIEPLFVAFKQMESLK